MIIHCFQLSDGPKLIPCEYSFALDAIRNKSAKVWMDILDADNNELKEKLDDLNIQGLVRFFCLDSRNHPGFYPLKPIALIVLPVQIEELDSSALEYLTLLYCTDFFVTVRSGKMARFRKTISAAESPDLLPDDSVAGVIATLMLGLSLDCLRKASALGDSIVYLEKQLERDPESVNIGEISAKRSQVLTLESIAQGQFPIIETVISSDRPSKSPETTLEYFRWAAANLKSADRKLEWLAHRIEILRSILEMNAQDRTNRRLARLTVLSTIFMPITFLAGIWGMNFEDMPGLSLRFGYVMALCIMFLISGGMYFYFRHKGWFK